MAGVQLVEQRFMLHRATADRQCRQLRIAAFVELGGNVILRLPLLAVVEILVQIYDHLVVKVDTVRVERQDIRGRSVTGLKDRGNIAAARDGLVQFTRLLRERMRFAEELQSHDKKRGKKQYIDQNFHEEQTVFGMCLLHEASLPDVT